ncbi:MAG TPA: adenylate/guanylate cyclase domain-containing protein [Candidatus Ozemobacteraceae bacterium]|nr:adenylate/guanylate cyclase domain-containing protein [Candidatus Ozemobacteraceae bacterium]HQG27174.1 adenylate/guanylate cyclase domain-containing protein [Candidatus Ozemobacteraceae bacterium]
MSRFVKQLVFIVGTLLLLLPPWLINATLSESEALERARHRQTTSELLDTSLHLAKHQDLGRLLLVDQLEEEIQRFTGRVISNEHIDLDRELRNAVARLERAGSPPLFTICVLDKAGRVAAHGGSTRAEFAFLHRFLQMNVRNLFEELPASETQEISGIIPDILGSIQTFGYFHDELRGSAAQVVFRGKEALLFWKPLIDRRRADVLLRSPIPDGSFEPGTSALEPHIRRQLVCGGILFLMPLPAVGERSIVSTIHRYASRGIRLAFVSEDGKSRFAHPSWRKPPLKTCLEGAPPPQGWAVSRGTAILGRRYTLFGAMKQPETGPGQNGSLVRTCCWAAAAMAILTWFSTLFRGGGVSRSLGLQLAAGFLLAALFPLSTMFLVIGPYVSERHEVRVQEIRNDLRRSIGLLELQAFTHRPRLWSLIRRMFDDRRFLDVARRDAGGDDPAARVDLQNRLKDKFLYLYNKPINLSLRKIAIGGMNNYVRDQSRLFDPSDGSGMLTELLRFTANAAIAARGGEATPQVAMSLSNDLERGSVQATKGEMLWDVGREIFLSVLGPETFFDWLNGKNEPILLEVGIGMAMLYEILLPNSTRPEFLVSLLIKSEFHENNAMGRTVSGPWRDGPVFAFQRDQIGRMVHPESGERHPFLRRIARQVDASSKSLSLSLSDGGTRWLIEGAPGACSRQFVFVALADEAPLLAETAAFRRRLTALFLVAALITLLLAASATQDIVSPVRSLIVGIQAVSEEDYSHRVPADRSDELGELADAFNKMARGLEERNILRKMVSSSALTAATSGDDERKAREGARREFIVCFVSFTGIEAAMSSMSPEAALELLNRHVVVVCRILHAAGADIDKLLGPKILAVFPPELALIAVKTARRLQAAHQEGALSFRPAVGMTIGSVVTGILGSGGRRDHTIIGDTVNLAARAAALAERFDPVAVVLDEALRQRAKDIGSYESLGETHVKGKARPVRLVRLVDQKRKRPFPPPLRS